MNSYLSLRLWDTHLKAPGNPLYYENPSGSEWWSAAAGPNLRVRTEHGPAEGKPGDRWSISAHEREDMLESWYLASSQIKLAKAKTVRLTSMFSVFINFANWSSSV